MRTVIGTVIKYFFIIYSENTVKKVLKCKMRKDTKKVSFFVRKKEANNMNNVIEVVPNKDGKIFITLYGTRYEIVVKKPAKETTNKTAE